jgi:hypothetical protein
MQGIKTIGLAALVAMALTAFFGAGTAAATALYSGATKLGAGTQIILSLSGTAMQATTEGTVLDTCTGGTVKGKTTNTGGPTETVKVNIEEMSWSNCTEPTMTVAKGSLEIHWTSSLNGTVTAGSVATDITVNTTIYGSCVFTFSAGSIWGSLTGSTSGDGVIDINTLWMRKSGLCPATTKWVGTYIVTSPTPLHVTAS